MRASPRPARLRSRAILGALLAVACAACGPAAPPPHEAGRARAEARADRSALGRFLADEDRIVTLLAATDPRIALRARVSPSDAQLRKSVVGAILAEDPDVGVEGGRTDVLSFDARGRALTAAAGVLAGWKRPIADPAPGRHLQPELERELLGRWLTAERSRLRTERELPRSAGTLVRGLVAGWRAPRTPQALAQRDEWLAKRLDAVAASLTAGALSLVEREDLEDALDPLETKVEVGWPRSQAALTRLRIAAENMQVAPAGKDRWKEVAAALAAQVGTTLTPETLSRLFESEDRQLRAAVDALMVVKATDEGYAAAVDDALRTPGDCPAPQTPSRLRRMQPPPERAGICALGPALEEAQTADQQLVVLMSMQAQVVAARWAIALAHGAGTGVLDAIVKPMAFLPPEREGRLLRFAATRPVEAIGRGLAVEWLMRQGMAAAGPRASAWLAFGDVPMDVLERELRPRVKLKDKPPDASAPQPPASPRP